MPTPGAAAREIAAARSPARGAPAEPPAPSVAGAQGQTRVNPVARPPTVDVKVETEPNNHEPRARMATEALAGAAAGGGAVPDMDQTARADGMERATVPATVRRPIRPSSLEREQDGCGLQRPPRSLSTAHRRPPAFETMSGIRTTAKPPEPEAPSSVHPAYLRRKPSPNPNQGAVPRVTSAATTAGVPSSATAAHHEPAFICPSSCLPPYRGTHLSFF